MKPTEKQISYLMYLLEKSGYGTRFMSAKFKELGATMRQRSGSVSDWVSSLTRAEVSSLIEKLK